MTTQQQESGIDRPNDPPQPPSSETGVTTDRMKRAGLLGVGAVLLLWGFTRRSARGVVAALVGTGVLAKTLSGDQTTTATVSRSSTIGTSPDELYDAWRDSDVFSQVMGGFAEITQIDEDRYRWTVDGPPGVDLSWETRVVEAEPGEVIRWETSGDTPIWSSGSVRFRPAAGGRGTVVTLSLAFEPPGGELGAGPLEQLDMVPETLAGHALGRFKSLVESGEIATLEGNPSGRGEGDLL